ncbi:serine/threonine protein phosphatase [Galdieria sulphuraria]|uniref:Serine/threonine-protein phosphatase n=1 Tax=Galdieria sulphuraria TaxID=130081 RepID=M2X012_GALSU|nr:serine/threonine protein phosphatase [Galdieria sulphuraria]EME29670.1 serine/threonine protein phosphatase [Galdieria sulphuraria]|eukprot:XP_005706190.1 serine/threonine protein phosphatase [Galdieria sulphuraria]
MPEMEELVKSRKQSEKRRGKGTFSVLRSEDGPLETGKEAEESDGCSYSEGEELDRPASVAAEELFDHDEELMFLEETVSQHCAVADEEDEETPVESEELHEDHYPPVDDSGNNAGFQNMKSENSKSEASSSVTADIERSIRAGSMPFVGVEMIDRNYLFLLLQRFQEVGWREDPQLLRNIFSPLDARRVIKEVTNIVSNEPTILEISVPEGGNVRVIGDIHGHLYDLGSILKLCGMPSERNFLLFNGDYVDRGSWGVEVLLILCILKLWKPKQVALLRGNHESSYCNVIYGFRRECLQKYGIKMYLTCQNLFANLPIAAVVSNRPCPSNCSYVSYPIPMDSVTSDEEKSWSSSFSTSLKGLFRLPKSSSPPSKLKNSNLRSPIISNTLETSRQQKCQMGGEKDMDYSTGSLPDLSPSSSFHNNENCPFIHRPPHYTLPLEQGEKRVLVLHGGLFRKANGDMGDLKDLMEVRRNLVDPLGTIEDALWSDPDHICGFGPNRWRGAGIAFGPDVTMQFLRSNRLHFLIRSHEGPDAREKRTEFPLLTQGYSVDFKCLKKVSSPLSSSPPSKTPFTTTIPETTREFSKQRETTGEERPIVITVFSAPCYPEGPNARKNKGAICILDELLEPQFETFSAMERPARSQTTNLMFGDLAKELNEASLERSKLGRMWLKLSGRGK